MSYDCPRCQSEQTQKVSIAYQSGISKINTSTTQGGVLVGNAGLNAGIGEGETSGVMQTEFSKSIAPPKEQPYTFSFFISAIVFGPILVFLTIFKIDNSVTIFLDFLLAIAAMIWAIKGIHKHNKIQYPPLMERWQRQFICLRCGTIFEPNQQNTSG